LARGAIETSKAKVTVTAHEHWLKTTTLAQGGHRALDSALNLVQAPSPFFLKINKLLDLSPAALLAW
jgi:hypothetical protein